MAPDGPPPLASGTLASGTQPVAEVPEPFAHRHLAALQERLARLEAESGAVTRNFVGLHGFSASARCAEADLLARMDGIVRQLEADIVRVHGLLRDTQRMLEQTESLWARAVIGALPA